MKGIRKTVATNVKTLRTRQNLTQEELGKKLGIHSNYLGLMERGERLPRLPLLVRMAKYFGVKPADLIFEEEKPMKLDSRQKELLKIINKGSKAEVDRLYEIAKVVLGRRY